jgi:hypothetical protein
VCKVNKLKKEEVEKASEMYISDRKIDIIAEVGQGLALPNDSKYRVMIKIAEHELRTDDPVLQEGNYNRWRQRFP